MSGTPSAYDVEKFRLAEDTSQDVSFYESADIENGILTIYGHWLGEDLERVFGRDEHEYTYTFTAESTLKLLKLLPDGLSDPKGALIASFGVAWGGALRKFCENNDIYYKMWTY